MMFKSLDSLKAIIRVNMNLKGHPGEDSHGNKESIIGHWRRS